MPKNFGEDDLNPYGQEVERKMMNIKLENEYLRENLRVRGGALNECQRERDLLKQENDELRARIAELENAVNRAIDANDMDDEEEKHSLIAKVNDTLLKKPEQSLAKLKADAIRDLLDRVHEGQIKVTITEQPYGCDWVDVIEWIDEQADKLEQDNEITNV